MGLTASFQIGRSALTASQLAIQVAGDNLANVSTPGFSRRVAGLSSTPGAGGPGLLTFGLEGAVTVGLADERRSPVP